MQREALTFLTELKRRKVFRVAAAYVAVAFVVIEAADLIFPRIPLPDWTVTLVVWLAILGFPVALGLAWAFDVTPEGIRRADTAEEEEERAVAGLARPRRRIALPVAGTASLAILAVAVIALQLRDRSADSSGDAAPVSAHALAILPFEIRGSPELSYLADGMVDLLATKLSGADDVRAVDPRALLDYVRRQRSSDISATAEAAARRFGAAYFVLGSVVEFGGRMQLRASLYDRERPTEPVAEASAEGDDDALFTMVDGLAGQLLAGLSEGTQGRLTRLAALTTDSIAALKHYLAGERAYREARFADAIGELERAIRIDSTFALAAYRLAHAAMWANEFDRLTSAMALAQRHAHSLAPRERTLLEAFAAALAPAGERQHARAEHLYRQIVQRYPDDVDAWYMLGELMLHDGAYLGYTRAEAAEPFARAVALSPEHSAALYHTANLTLAAAPHDTAALASVAARLLQVSGDSLLSLTDLAYARREAALQRRLETRMPAVREPINSYYANVAANYAVASDRPTARRVWEIIARTSPSAPVKAMAIQSLAAVEQAWGHLAAAERELNEATRLNEYLGWQERVRLALHPLRPLAPAALRTLRDSLAAWTPSPEGPLPDNLLTLRFGYAIEEVRTYLIGALDVHIDPAAARRTASALSSRTGGDTAAVLARDLGVVLQAEVDRAAGDPASALRRLESARFWGASPIAIHERGTLTFSRQVFLRAELLRELGRSDDAAHWYRVAGDHFLDYRSPALHRLCQLHAAAGRTAEAATACARFVDLWRDADPELQTHVADARNILARLLPDRRAS